MSRPRSAPHVVHTAYQISVQPLLILRLPKVSREFLLETRTFFLVVAEADSRCDLQLLLLLPPTRRRTLYSALSCFVALVEEQRSGILKTADPGPRKHRSSFEAAQEMMTTPNIKCKAHDRTAASEWVGIRGLHVSVAAGRRVLDRCAAL